MTGDAARSAGIAQYVYAIAERYPTERLDHVRGIDGAAVTLIQQDGLCALASPTTVEPFRATGQPSEIAETSWLAEAVRAHEGVAEAALGEAAVLPMRFGAVYSSDDAVLAALGRHRTALLAELRRVGLGTEWGLKVGVSANPDEQPAVTVPAEVRQPVTGTDWMLRRSSQLRERTRQREQLGQCYADVHASMRASAREVALSATARGGSTAALELSFLVDDVDGFHAAYESLRDRYVPQGFSFRLTGPWPPYHFVRVAELGGDDG